MSYFVDSTYDYPLSFFPAQLVMPRLLLTFIPYFGDEVNHFLESFDGHSHEAMRLRSRVIFLRVQVIDIIT
jgi:hypothetical protein